MVDVFLNFKDNFNKVQTFGLSGTNEQKINKQIKSQSITDLSRADREYHVDGGTELLTPSPTRSDRSSATSSVVASESFVS